MRAKPCALRFSLPGVPSRQFLYQSLKPVTRMIRIVAKVRTPSPSENTFDSYQVVGAPVRFALPERYGVLTDKVLLFKKSGKKFLLFCCSEGVYGVPSSMWLTDTLCQLGGHLKRDRNRTIFNMLWPNP